MKRLENINLAKSHITLLIKGILIKGLIICLIPLTSCSQKTTKTKEIEPSKTQKTPHQYGGWYCPDNLIGFPPVDIKDWKQVPVVKGRMPLKSETSNGTSLIYVDSLKYPDAKIINIDLPKLATVYNESSKRIDYIIIIQAFQIDNDSIVGYRFLNGGNGSARFNEVHFLSENFTSTLSNQKFVTSDIKIKATRNVVWEVITNEQNTETLAKTIENNDNPNISWRKLTNVNYYYKKPDTLSNSFAGNLWGNVYIQNDFLDDNYTEKFLLLENKQTGTTELKIVCGPFTDDFIHEQSIINKWTKKVKELSETNELIKAKP